MGSEVLLFVPNLIGYLRIFLLTFAYFTYSHPVIFLPLYCVSVALDAFDGYAARKLSQTSAFGAWLDVVIDIVGRGMLWCNLYSFGYFVVALEWVTFVCTHTLGSQWKSSFIQTPWFVKGVMTNNFHSVMGFIAIGSLHFLPIWLYAHYTKFLTVYLHVPSFLQYLGISLLSAGRALCAAVEIWCVYAHICYLLDAENPHSSPAPPKNRTSNSPHDK